MQESKLVPSPATSGQPGADASLPHKPALFRRWLQRNPGIQQHIQTADWRFFLQFILRFLQAPGGDAETEAVLDERLPRLFGSAAPSDMLVAALADLHGLISDYFIRRRNQAQAVEAASLKTLNRLFDQIFSKIEQLPSLQGGAIPAVDKSFTRTVAAPRNGSLEPAVERLLNAPARFNKMTFRTGAARFSGKCKLNPALLDWLGIESPDSTVLLDWQPMIHPDDLPGIQAKYLGLARDQSPFYELSYRLQDRNGEWKHVVELGLFEYGASGQVLAVNGLIVEIDDPAGHLHQIPAAELFNALLDPARAYMMLINGDARITYLSSPLYPMVDPREWNGPPGQGATAQPSFLGLPDPGNRKVAENFWVSLTRKGKLTKKFLLKLSEPGSAEQQVIEFSPYLLERIFPKAQFLLWGKAIPKKQPENMYTARLALLGEFSREIYRPADLNGFYRKLMEFTSRLIPGAARLVLLVRTAEGYKVGLASGFDARELQDRVITSHPLASGAKPAASQDAFPYLFGDETVMAEIASRLYGTLTPANGKAGASPAPGTDLAGLVKVQETVHSLIYLSSEPGHPFDENDRHLLALLAQEASFALNNLQLSQKLQENEFNVSAIFENSPLALFILQEGELKLFNRKLPDFLGIGAADGFPNGIWEYVHPDDIAGLQEKLGELNRQFACAEYEFRMMPPRQQPRDCYGVFIYIQYHHKPAILGEILDITRLRDLERQLLRTQKLESLGSLTAGIAHDFNNILGTIIPNAQLLLKQEDSGETHKRSRIIFQMAQRAAMLTQQLLSYAVLSKRQPDVCNLNGLVLEARELLTSTTGPNITLTYDLEAELPNVSGSRNNFLQLLVNLIANARDALPEGGDIEITTRHIQIEASPETRHKLPAGRFVQLTVRDNGVGIPREIRPQIFRPFFTTKSNAPGSGLGLSIVQDIVKKHDGFITVRSEAQEGSTFRILLPVTARPAAVAPPEPPAAEIPHPENSKTFLVVDDEKYMREVLVSMLRLMGHASLEAANGKEALQLYKAHREQIDLVILDYGMRGLNGKQTYQLLKKLNPQARVLFCTGYGEQSDVAEFIRSEKLYFLPKPFTYELLQQKLGDVFEAEKVSRQERP